MNSKTTARVQQMEDGPHGNSRRLYVIMLSVQVLGIDKPFEHRIGEFYEGYESFARAFCKWINEGPPAQQQEKQPSIYDNNPKCERCGDTPSAGDGAWRIRDGMKWDHRCRDIHPQCGYEPCPPGYLPDKQQEKPRED